MLVPQMLQRQWLTKTTKFIFLKKLANPLKRKVFYTFLVDTKGSQTRIHARFVGGALTPEFWILKRIKLINQPTLWGFFYALFNGV